MSLKTRFSLLAIALILVASTATWWSFRWVATGIIEQWGHHVAEARVRYDSNRLLQPLERDIALARQMAESAVLKRWALDANDPALTGQAMAELARFRRDFQDRDQFLALADSGAYYYSVANGSGSLPLRYQLAPEDPYNDRFYRLMATGRDLHLNVTERPPGETRLWIDVPLRADGRTLGLVGTGLDPDTLLRDSVASDQPRATSLFVDGDGTLQLYRGAGVTEAAGRVAPDTLAGMLDTPEGRQRVDAMMASLQSQASGELSVRTGFASANGKRYILGIASLPRNDWFGVTLVDPDQLLPMRSLAPVVAVFAGVLLGALLIFLQVLKSQVLDPLAALDRAMKQVRRGELDEPRLPPGRGEIGRLIQHFASMASAIRNHTRELEDKVQERTEALHTLARIDPLTELINRRGMNEVLQESLERTSRYRHTFGVIWLDIDLFKELNDSLGHAAGDDALVMVANVLRETLRPYDKAARWGGDEFLIMLSPCDEVALETIGERIRGELADKLERSGWPITASLGGYLTQPGDSRDTILQRADEAMYRAKMAGRNRFMMAGQA